MIRLAVEVKGGSLQFWDLFWLSDWNTDFPQAQVFKGLIDSILFDFPIRNKEKLIEYAI